MIYSIFLSVFLCIIGTYVCLIKLYTERGSKTKPCGSFDANILDFEI